jgi:hypothetical protein
MKYDERKQNDDNLKGTKEQANTTKQSTEKDNSDKKETLEERAKREHWTDVAESHLGIDE